MAKGDVI